VVAFEPNPNNYLKVKKNVNINLFENVIIINIAIGDKTDELNLMVPEYLGGMGSLLNRDYKNCKTHKVQVKSLDYILKQRKIPIPDFIKIDIEGYELKALYGMRNLLKNNKPKLFIEVHNFETDNMFNIINFLKNYKYNIIHIESGGESQVILNNKIKSGHIYCE
jgi:FkbM family methyltransferase